MPYKCSCGYTNEGPSFAAHFKYHKGDENHKKLGWLDPATGELLAEKPRPGRKLPGPAGQPSAPSGVKSVVQKGVVQVAALSSGKAPVLFQLAQETIPIDFGDLYECFQLYQDISARGLIGEQSFCDCLKDSVALAWTVLVGQPKIEDGHVRLEEVSHDRGDSRSDEKEAGVEQTAAG